MLFVRKWRQLATGLITLLGCAVCAAPAWAEPASEQAVKAGFIFNFVKFTQWGPGRDNSNEPLQICTPGSQPLDGQFSRLNGRSLGTRAIEIRANVAAGDWHDCEVLFISEADAGRVDSILRTLGNAPVLTVGDFTGFVRAGGMIGLRMEDTRVKFDVNLASAQRAGLLLNSQMLKLAGQVIK